jgi:23S rRNA pseudouridine1911/1915/1917 synthase
MIPSQADRTITVPPEYAGKRLDQFLAAQLTDVSRNRVQQMIAGGCVRVNGAAARASLKLRGEEQIEIAGDVQPPPLRALPEEIPLRIVYEDDDLAIVDKPAGMMVHAGSGATDEQRNRGTLVNALLHHFGTLSSVGGELRPGIVHRLDKQTSGLIVVAKNDVAHRKLAAQFSSRTIKKQYVALVHGWMKQERGRIESAIQRDRIRRTRMTTKRGGGREALTDYYVRRKLTTPWGRFSLLELNIHTGRTHQIRVHMASLGHPVVGDTLYGAPRELRSTTGKTPVAVLPTIDRNFLHAAHLELVHPRTGAPLSLAAPLPDELEAWLHRLESAT